MARGKHGQAAAVRHEVQQRDAEIARLTHERDRLATELKATKARLAEYQTKLGSWSHRDNERVQQQIRDGVVAGSALIGTKQGYDEGLSAWDRASSQVYRLHLVAEHGLTTEEANAQALRETQGIANRAFRRRALKPRRDVRPAARQQMADRAISAINDAEED
ncbi:MAG TPA: hypothetical protein VFH80_23645 [Solirubrobacteraceae bacterium]|nr:hypothetical protein [Solirubrobacteraceae bacterium]